MSRVPEGSRVGAILSADKEEVRLFGYGVYNGRREPPFGPDRVALAEFEEMKARREWPADLPYTDQMITLDDGRIVWGCMCWWGSEETVKAMIGSRRVVLVDLDGGPIGSQQLLPEAQP